MANFVSGAICTLLLILLAIAARDGGYNLAAIIILVAALAVAWLTKYRNREEGL